MGGPSARNEDGQGFSKVSRRAGGKIKESAMF